MSKTSDSPFRDFIDECEEALRRSVKEAYPSHGGVPLDLARPPEDGFGELSSSLCFKLAQCLKDKPQNLADKVVDKLVIPRESLIQRVEVAGGGYINFFADYSRFSELTLDSARALRDSYGYVEADEALNIIVEHTSVNPAGPIHVGTARNSILGDSLCRILKARGHEVNAHFYVDDVGRQIAVLAYGFRSVKHIPEREKIDHWLGQVYAAASCIIEAEKLEKSLQGLRGKASAERIREIQLQREDWLSAADYLRYRDEATFHELLDGIQQDASPEKSISKIMRSYEEGESEAKRLVRGVVELCLSGFRETYDRMDITWDSWDWESGLVWNSSVDEVVSKLEKTPYCKVVDGALEFDADKAALEEGVKEALGVYREHEIPSLVLKRSDGTTLYSTRDIAYSLWKLSRSDKVINVIGKEQALAQTQIKIALSTLTSSQKALSMMHYAYELVQLPGYRMSKRKGRYVTLDEILDEAEKRAYREVEKRSPNLSQREKEEIARAVGRGAVKYALVSIAPSKQVIFRWDRVLDFDTNSAPFIQYAYARASNILKKADATPREIDYSSLQKPVEHGLVRRIALFPEAFKEASERLNPHVLSEYANELSASFNSFYASIPVLQAESPELRGTRLALVESVKICIRNSMSLLGIDVLERM